MLRKKILELNLNNCSMLPFQPAEALPYSLAAADIAVVTQGRDASKMSVPSKTYNFMSVGAPLLCITGDDSELKRLVNYYKIGKCFKAEQIDEMKNFVWQLKQNPAYHSELSENTLKASRHFGPENINKFLY